MLLPCTGGSEEIERELVVVVTDGRWWGVGVCMCEDGEGVEVEGGKGIQVAAVSFG